MASGIRSPLHISQVCHIILVHYFASLMINTSRNTEQVRIMLIKVIVNLRGIFN